VIFGSHDQQGRRHDPGIFVTDDSGAVLVIYRVLSRAGQ
jgi:hypothetical protein